MTATYLCVGGDCDGSRVAVSVWPLMQPSGVVGDQTAYQEQTVTLGRAKLVVLVPADWRDDDVLARLVDGYVRRPFTARIVPT